LPKDFWIQAVKGRGSLSMGLNGLLFPMPNGMGKAEGRGAKEKKMNDI